MSKTTREHWEGVAQRSLKGRTIKEVRYTSDAELEALGWTRHVVVLGLDDGSLVFPSMDDEGNEGGALFGQDAKGVDITLPVIDSRSIDTPMGGVGDIRD
jgi:hypothetical protein